MLDNIKLLIPRNLVGIVMQAAHGNVMSTHLQYDFIYLL